MDTKTCFVIMPYGTRSEGPGKKKIDFDEVYDTLIEKAVAGVKLECVRCDKLENAGSIHARMIEHIYNDAVAIVDISTLNPNVFYELGVRQALKPSVTVVIRQKGTNIPFNINGLTVIEYDLKDERSRAEGRRKIKAFINAGLTSNGSDSLVHDILPLKISTRANTIDQKRTIRYPFEHAPDKSLCITTGDIRNVKAIHAWVSSENTYMQMARFFDKSVSSVVRYLGAEKNRSGAVIRDLIADELKTAMDGATSVPPAHVIWTGSGELKERNGVRVILHVAAVWGQLGAGYRPVDELGACVTNALRQLDHDDLSASGCTSVLFPLLGSGTAKGEPGPIAKLLAHAAARYVVENPSTNVKEIHFLAWNEAELAACRQALDRMEGLQRPREPATSVETKREASTKPANGATRRNGHSSSKPSSKRPKLRREKPSTTT